MLIEIMKNNATSELCMLNTNILLLLCISCGQFNLIEVMNETVLSFLHVVEHRGHV